MLVEIEQAIINTLEAAGINCRAFDADEDKENPLRPMAFVNIESGDFKRITIGGDKYKQETTIELVVIFKTDEGETERREGMYLILEGIRDTLLGQTLGLNITPLEPTSFKNTTDPEDSQRNEIWYVFTFKTSYTVSKVEAETALDLLKIGVNAYLQAPTDDGVADSTAEVDVS